MLLTLLAPVARAYVVACAPFVSATLPAPNATYVPLDIRPLVLLDGTACASAWAFTAELMDETGTVLATASISQDDAPERHIALLPDADLAPNATYIVRVSPTDGFGNGTQVSFSTGEDYAAQLNNLAPALTLRSALREKGEDEWTMTATGVSQGEANYALDHALFVLDPEDRVVAVSLPDEAGIAAFSASWTGPEGEKELCLRGREENGAGLSGPVSSERCMESERSGCATTRSPRGFAPAVVGLLALRRRRS